MTLLLHLHTQMHLLLRLYLLDADSVRVDRARTDRARTDSVLTSRVAERRRTDRGSVTIEQVIWAGAVIVIVGIVVAAITSYVTNQAGKIQ